ncbi:MULTISPECIES: carbon starvation CstA family protein [Shewanella]|uniref:Carbon starvation protein A n=2 Tax=Unclassified Bacteria TaxID=49928 RepID=A0AAU6VXM6_UNCXX|nr:MULTISPECIES: carbon starvation protein A [Shewanella]MBO2557421.1 carbon starvation protein A [Shewanella algae]MBO2574356.1 carbon starvation protein A [Shewanella algae]MBO2612712.1 carbon starvation protein A [Shewanella algae]MBO2616834.1 carbon starvation protein A [Shewanella algae]MBO2633561.1 carbon starvation protein A [Shewanella algae]
MMWFLLCVGLLIGGYFIYGTFVEKIFGINNKRQTPAYAQTDGVDYVPMSKGKVYLIQLLNIAGVGPIFGPILGALYGPAAMLWIVIGCIFAGAVHDYFSGMLSVRNGGQSVPNLAGKYLGKGAKNFMNIFAIILLLLVGVVFISAPAGLLGKLTGGSVGLFVGIIFVYYLIATIVPVDKIIGRLYPFFGALLLFMSVGLTIAIVLSSEHTLLPGFEAGDFLQNLNPDNAPLWPALFITIACGAVSGFHATQSPLMARCVENESNGRFVFYGAMIGEGIIALIWCAVALSFFDGVEGLKAGMDGNPANVVYGASTGLLGAVGGFMAVLGVIILPITSGDTAFRSARLILSEYFNMPQTEMPKRLMLAIPLFIIGAILTQVDFGVIWRYFGVANQATAVMMLWTASAYLLRHNKLHWICTIPAMFMTTVVISFLLNSSTLGAGLPMTVSTISGIVVTLLVTALVIIKTKGRNEVDEVIPEEG